MSLSIEQRLTHCLQPLLTFPVIVKGDPPATTHPYAELSMISCTPLGMADECCQEVDDEGRRLSTGVRRAEIMIQFWGDQVVAQLLSITECFKLTTLSYSLQHLNIGTEGLPQLISPTQKGVSIEPYLRFFIHYSIPFHDPIGIIETIQAATDRGNLSIRLTR